MGQQYGRAAEKEEVMYVWPRMPCLGNHFLYASKKSFDVQRNTPKKWYLSPNTRTSFRWHYIEAFCMMQCVCLTLSILGKNRHQILLS